MSFSRSLLTCSNFSSAASWREGFQSLVDALGDGFIRRRDDVVWWRLRFFRRLRIACFAPACHRVAFVLLTWRLPPLVLRRLGLSFFCFLRRLAASFASCCNPSPCAAGGFFCFCPPW